MDTNGVTHIFLDPISLDNPSSFLPLLLALIALAFIAGLLIILVNRRHNSTAERPPVFGAEPEKDNENESSQGVDMTVPGAEELTLSQEDISLHPVPHLGHPDDEGVPVPKYDEEVKALVVDTDVAPVDVNADVPVMPISDVPTPDISVPDAPTDNTDKETTDMNDMNMDETENQNTQAQPDTESVNTESTNADSANAANPFDSVKEKFEEVFGEVKEKATAFLEGEGEDAPLERIKRAALDVKDIAEEKAGELKEKAHEMATSEKAQELRSTLEAKAEEAKEKAEQLWEKAKASAQDEDSLIGQAKRKAQDLKEKAEDYFQKDAPQENPESDTE